MNIISGYLKIEFLFEKILLFFLKVTFYLVNAHFFPFLSRKKKKEVGERKKKKDRGRFLAARRKHARISRLAVLGTQGI